MLTTLRGLALLGWALLFVVVCDDGPTKPKPTPPKDYVVYGGSWVTDSLLYAYHPLTDQLDSLIVPVKRAGCMAVSADGRRLYIGERIRTSIIDLATLTVVGAWPHPLNWPIAVSPDNQHVAMYGADGLYVYRTDDQSLVYRDTTQPLPKFFRFSSDSRWLYWQRVDTTLVVCRLDMQTWEEERISRPHFAGDRAAGPLIPTRDGRYWFRYAPVASLLAKFEMYEPATDSVLFREYLSPGFGTLTLSPDERYVFYAEGAALQGDYDGASQFTVFDVASRRIKTIVSPVGFVDGIQPMVMAIGELVVTPDNRWLVANRMPTGTSFLAFDISATELVAYHEFPRIVGGWADAMGFLSVQQQP